MDFVIDFQTGKLIPLNSPLKKAHEIQIFPTLDNLGESKVLSDPKYPEMVEQLERIVYNPVFDYCNGEGYGCSEEKVPVYVFTLNDSYSDDLSVHPEGKILVCPEHQEELMQRITSDEGFMNKGWHARSAIPVSVGGACGNNLIFAPYRKDNPDISLRLMVYDTCKKQDLNTLLETYINMALKKQ